MTPHVDLPTLAARARGLRTRLLGRAQLEALAAPDLGAFARALSATRAVPAGVPQPARIADVQGAIRRAAVQQLRTLDRWEGHAGPLHLFYAEQERRSVRALLRGAIEGAPPEARLAAALPTPRLPERALRELATQPSAAKVAARLAVLRYASATLLLPVVAVAQPVLFDVDQVLLRGFAERVRAACRTGDHDLVSWGRGRIDLANAETALALSHGATELDPAACFVEGGKALAKPAFVEASSAGSGTRAATLLARAVKESGLADALRASAGDPVYLESHAFARALSDERRRARVHPLGSAPTLLFLLRLEAQTRDLLRLAWGAALGAPPSSLTADLVTPWS